MSEKKDTEKFSSLFKRAGDVANVVYGFFRSKEIRQEVTDRVENEARNFAQETKTQAESLRVKIDQGINNSRNQLVNKWNESSTMAKNNANNWVVDKVEKTAKMFVGPGEAILSKIINGVGTVDNTISIVSAEVVGVSGDVLRDVTKRAGVPLVAAYSVIDSVVSGLEENKHSRGLGERLRWVANIAEKARDRVLQAHRVGNQYRQAANEIRAGLFGRNMTRINMQDSLTSAAAAAKA